MVATFDVLGTTVAMPVQVRDASAAAVIWDVDAAAAQALLPAVFRVIETTPRRAQFALVLVDYRDNDLGSYLEVGLTLFVRPAAGGADGSFITRLPVDQAFTCAAGELIWGFPKTVEDISRDGSTWALRMDGELVLRVTLPCVGTDVLEPMDLLAYTLKDGVPHVTAFTQGGSEAGIGLGEGVALELGDHPVARELASLRLGVPVLTSWTGRAQMTFGAPSPA